MEASSSHEADANTGEEPHAQDLDESTYKPQHDSDGLSAMDRQYAAQPDVPREIHILGASGSIGKLVAHSLKGIANPPPVTLLLHRYGLIKAWEAGKQEITLLEDGKEVTQSGYEVELMPEVRKQHGVQVDYGQPDVYDRAQNVKPHEAAQIMQQEQQEDQKEADAFQEPAKPKRERRELPGDKYMSEGPIHNLVVTVKAARTIAALNAIRHRLTPASTICFLQNGMGIVDEVNEKLFPDQDTRPNYMQGIITHGVNVPPEKAQQDPFYAIHAGHGTIALALLPRTDVKDTADKDRDPNDIQSQKWAPSSRYLLRTLTRSPVLCAVGFTPTELLQQQLEKVAVNSILNPLTSLLDARNGTLLHNFPLTRTIRLMLAETSHVVRSLPELQGIPNVNLRFSPERLETIVFSVADKTRDNISSMLADVRAGRVTEVEYINGYIVRRGEEVGIKCVVNYAMMQAVIGKAAMVGREMRDEVPRGKNLTLE